MHRARLREGMVLLNCHVLRVLGGHLQAREKSSSLWVLQVRLHTRSRLLWAAITTFTSIASACAFQGENIILQIAQLKKFSSLCLHAVGMNYLISGEIGALAQVFVVTCMSIVLFLRAELSCFCHLVFPGCSDLSPSSPPSYLFHRHLRSFLSLRFPPDV